MYIAVIYQYLYMRLAFLFLLLFTNLFGYTQITEGWFKVFKGKIDKYPVTLLLHHVDDKYTRYYYYDSREQLMALSYGVSSGDTIKLGANGDEQFLLFLRDKNLWGSWQKDQQSKRLTFSATETNAPIAFSYLAISGETKLRPSLKDSPMDSYAAATVWPVSSSPADAYLKKVITDSFFMARRNDDIRDVLTKSMEGDFADYLEEGGDVFDAEIKQMPLIYNRESTTNVTVAYVSPKIVCFSAFSYSYSGGAHGNYGTTFRVVDVKRNKVLSIKDIIIPEGLTKLPQLLEKHFRSEHDLAAQDSLQEAGLFENNIEPNENFYLTAKGIGFNYTPYEIAPYVMGEIEIFIPFTELKGYLYDPVE
jgi:hypothetical protein